MSFGMTNAPAVFQALVSNVLRDMLNKILFVYIDNMLIFLESDEEHTQHVLTVLRPYNQTLQNTLRCVTTDCPS